jgi:hypothetical protein
VYREAMMEKRRAAGLARVGFDSRYGVPDGMRKAQAEPLNQAALESAKVTVSKLKAAGALVGADDRAEAALTEAVKIMRAPGDKKVKLGAARLVLDFTKAKPANKTELTINAAEQWLKEVAEHDGDEGETPKDA